MGYENSISARNRKAAKDSETLLWRAMRDNMEDAIEYIAPDCVMINPLISSEVLHKEGTPVQKALSQTQPFAGYQMDKDQQIVEIDMMAVQIMYHGSFTTAGGQQVRAACASTWRQVAGGDWFLCAMLLAPTGM